MTEIRILTMLQIFIKKKIDELTDIKEALQIEVSNAAADLAKLGRRYENLKKQALNMQEEFNATKEELERERQLREKDKNELEAAVAELNNFRLKYREENKRMKEAVQERDESVSQLSVAREQIERLNKIVEERTQQLSKDKATVEMAYIQERNNLIEQLESLNKELRNERINAARRIQEHQELVDTQLKEQIEDLKAKAKFELERRVTLAVESALANAAAQAEETKQQSMTAARIAFNEEKEKNNKMLLESFNNRLQEEIKSAYEKGRQAGFKESGRVGDSAYLQLKEMEFENIKQSLEKEIESQKRIIASLSSKEKEPPKENIFATVSKGGYSLEEMTNIVKVR